LSEQCTGNVVPDTVQTIELDMPRRVLFFVILGVVILAAAAYWRFRASALDAARPRPAPVVAVGTPILDTLTRVAVFTGDVLPVQQASIYSRVSGNIEAMVVDIGSSVKRGQLLALIDTTLFAQNVRQTYGIWRQAEATAKNLQVTYERTKSLFDKKLGSQQELENSETALSVAKAQSDAAQANYRNAVTTLSYCRITAPFSGYITRRSLDAGAYVNNNPASQSSSLFTLMALDTVHVFVNVVERDIQILDTVSGVEVSVDGLPGQLFTGRINRIGQALDVGTRTLPVQIVIPNPKRELKPGMFATTRIILERRSGVPSVPAEVVMKDDQGAYLFTVGADSVAHKRPVTIGISERNRIELRSSIPDGERIVTDGQHLLRDGVKVRIR
jgi:membrane fusion protein (multidrug efflux system)